VTRWGIAATRLEEEARVTASVGDPLQAVRAGLTASSPRPSPPLLPALT